MYKLPVTFVLYIFTILYYFQKVNSDEHLKTDMQFLNQQLNNLRVMKNAQMDEVTLQCIV